MQPQVITVHITVYFLPYQAVNTDTLGKIQELHLCCTKLKRFSKCNKKKCSSPKFCIYFTVHSEITATSSILEIVIQCVPIRM